MPSYLETAILNPSSDMVNLIKSVPSSPDIRVYDRSVEEIALEKIQSNSSQKWDTDQENAFFIGDLGEVFRQHLRWKALLPRIEPFFGKFRFKNV
jgi:ornithine decarboxylase